MVLAFCVSPYFPESWKSFFYGLSMNLKDTLVFIVPFVIVSYLYRCFQRLGQGALKFMGLLFGAVCLSNYISMVFGYLGGVTFLKFYTSEIPHLHLQDRLPALFHLDYAPLFSNRTALILGICFGVCQTLVQSDYVEKTMSKLGLFVDIFLKSVFPRVLPLFIFGFLIKMEHENMLEVLYHGYFATTLYILSLIMVYCFVSLGMTARWNSKRMVFYARNLFPASLTAFGSMSSMAALPLNLHAAEKNSKNPELAQGILSATVNPHLVGDSIALGVLILMTMKIFLGTVVAPFTFFVFAVYWTIAKLAMVAVPAAGVLMIIPLLESHLGFSGEMTGIITAVYMLLDPFITSGNVTFNGIFATYVSNRVQKKI